MLVLSLQGAFMRRIYLSLLLVLMSFTTTAGECVLTLGTLVVDSPMVKDGPGYYRLTDETQYRFRDLGLERESLQTNNWKACYFLALERVGTYPFYKDIEHFAPFNDKPFQVTQEKILMRWTYRNGPFYSTGAVDRIAAMMSHLNASKGLQAFNQQGQPLRSRYPFLIGK